MQRYPRGFCIIVLILGILTTGCTTVYKSAVDERSVGQQYDDEKITMVYLVGEYDTVDQRNQAVKLAREVAGVKSVTDYFLPKKKDDTCGTTDNLKLSAKVSADLIGDKEISSTQIEVKAVQCQIVLLGLVGSADQINKAIAHAKSVEGVRSVKSFLTTQK